MQANNSSKSTQLILIFNPSSSKYLIPNRLKGQQMQVNLLAPAAAYIHYPNMMNHPVLWKSSRRKFTKLSSSDRSLRYFKWKHRHSIPIAWHLWLRRISMVMLMIIMIKAKQKESVLCKKAIRHSLIQITMSKQSIFPRLARVATIQARKQPKQTLPTAGLR